MFTEPGRDTIPRHPGSFAKYVYAGESHPIVERRQTRQIYQIDLKQIANAFRLSFATRKANSSRLVYNVYVS